MMPVEDAFGFVQQQLDSVMRTGTYAMGFVIDVAMEMLQNRLNVFRITDELAGLEGRPGRATTTKPPKMFTGQHLRGYWHKHHTQAAYMAENLRLEMERDNTLHRVLAKYIGQDLTPEIFNELSHALVTENYLHRSGEGRLTGEWIVYSEVEGRKHYLTLARHTEGDEVIAERLHRYEHIDRETGWVSGKCGITRVDVRLLPDGGVPEG